VVAAFSGSAGEAIVEYQATPDRTVIGLDLDQDTQADLAVYLAGDQRGFDGFVW